MKCRSFLVVVLYLTVTVIYTMEFWFMERKRSSWFLCILAYLFSFSPVSSPCEGLSPYGTIINIYLTKIFKATVIIEYYETRYFVFFS